MLLLAMFGDIAVSMTKINTNLLKAIRNTRTPLYCLALQAGFHPSRLSQIVNGAEIKRPHDVRFKLLAKAAQYSGEIFQTERGNNDNKNQHNF